MDSAPSSPGTIDKRSLLMPGRAHDPAINILIIRKSAYD
jgi:hypothetical protein